MYIIHYILKVSLYCVLSVSSHSLENSDHSVSQTGSCLPDILSRAQVCTLCLCDMSSASTGKNMYYMKLCVCVCRSLSMRWKWTTSMPTGETKLMCMTSCLTWRLRDAPPPQFYTAPVSSSTCSSFWTHGTGTNTNMWCRSFVFSCTSSKNCACVHQSAAGSTCSVMH